MSNNVFPSANTLLLKHKKAELNVKIDKLKDLQNEIKDLEDEIFYIENKHSIKENSPYLSLKY